MHLPHPGPGARSRIPRIVLAADLVLLAAGLVTGSQMPGGMLGPGLIFNSLIAALVIGLAVIGGLIVDRQPGNAVGWIFVASGAGMAVANPCYAWAALSQARYGNGLPGTVFAAWLNSWIAIPALVSLVVFVPLLFPDGHPLSPRWRWVVAAGIVGVGLTTIGSALAPVTFDPTGIRNPVGIDLGQPLSDALGLVDGVSGLAIFALSVVALVLRYRRGSAVERLQLRWFVVPVAIAIVCFGLSSLPDVVIFGDIGWIAAIVAITAMPWAIGIAILRYQLYEIEVLLNRTAVYATVTVILVAAFFVGNVALQSVFTALTSQRSEILSGALGVGAGLLFVPIRTRIRPIVDRVLPGRAVVALLFTDIVESTETLVEVGDERWRALLAEYLATVRRQLARHGGHEINTAGDAFFATFNRPVDALNAAWAIRHGVEQLGLRTRTGLHLGEVEMRGEQVSGIAVHTAARVMATASEGEVLASDAIREALEGTSVSLADRGSHHLKGVPGTWQLYAVELPAISG